MEQYHIGSEATFSALLSTQFQAKIAQACNFMHFRGPETLISNPERCNAQPGTSHRPPNQPRSEAQCIHSLRPSSPLRTIQISRPAKPPQVLVCAQPPDGVESGRSAQVLHTQTRRCRSSFMHASPVPNKFSRS
ncbi:unnamed protein product [Ostreobium quekettii]|uniref:Uncharacterized protein n=1 Tax=Ostreobium quekettii TaxID=121088 RepID=A0A8S1IQ21_9CHLO|nr:unnamed protein product [Ostreobium quekettii]